MKGDYRCLHGIGRAVCGVGGSWFNSTIQLILLVLDSSTS